VLTSGGGSSVVIDHLCSQARGQNTTVAGFYFDFASQNEQPPTRFLGSLLKQMVFGFDEIPEEISGAYDDRRNAVGGQGLQISDLLKMLQTTSAHNRAFICIDALDECATEHIAKVLDSLSQLLQKSLPQVRARLGGPVTSISISPKRDDIITYIHSRLAADTTSDAMDSSLEADILEKIHSDISEMYVEATTLRNTSQVV